MTQRRASRCPLVICILLFALSPFNVAAQDSGRAAMYAHFIDVGQADATLLEFPSGAILIDAGAQDAAHRDALMKYLRDFFQRRTNLHNTLDLILITHCHVDHDLVLDSIAMNFRVCHYIDNGVHTGSGRKNQLWMESRAAALKIPYRSYTFEEATVAGCEGIVDTIDSPVRGGLVNPVVHILSGRFARQPAGWTNSDFNNGNNHSLVVKVTFGQASFLFTGDLETAGINTVLQAYHNCSALDVDILRVGHHGAENATTPEFLKAVTPSAAIISCGQWNYGQGPPVKAFTTFTYGHPRLNTLTALGAQIAGKRAMQVTIHAATASKQFVSYTETQEVYDTAWDHNIILEATSDGKYYLLAP